MGPIVAKRVLVDGVAIPDITSVAYDNPLIVPLLICQESINEETESDGAGATAECTLYSKVVGCKLDIKIRGTTDDELTLRWMIYKSPDQDITSATAMDQFHKSDDTTAAREVRANILAKGYILTNISTGVTNIRAFIRRETLKRLGSLKENDLIRFLIAANSAATVQAQLNIMGTIYVRMN